MKKYKLWIIELYFNGKLSEDKFRSFKAAIAKGNWLLKLTKYKPGYDKAYNVENLKELKQDELFGRIVFQLKTKDGYLDITLGSTTAIDKIIFQNKFSCICHSIGGLCDYIRKNWSQKSPVFSLETR